VTQTRAGSKGDKSVSTSTNELVSLVVAYAKQETVDPLRNLGRFVAFGIAGAILVATGGLLVILTVVRVLQTETGGHLRGNLSWVPYTGGILLAVLGIGWALSRVNKGLR
jgi:cytochrome c biogenesis protein CcdA